MIQNLKLIHVHPSSTNPRKHFDDNKLAQLADSIKQHGVLQPVLVRESVDNKTRVVSYELVAGERRFRAAKLAGKEDIPAIVRELTDVEVLEIQVIENAERDDLHPLEEAAGFKALILTKQYDVAKIAQRLSRSTRYVYERLKLLELIPVLQGAFLDGTITAGHAVLLARLSKEDQERCALHPDEIDSRHDGLFRHDNGLFDNNSFDDMDESQPIKAISVRELERWIATHVKFDRHNVDPMLFPETAENVAEAQEQKAKIIPITRSYRSSDDIRKAGKERIYGEQAWKRADGINSDECEYSVLGVIVDGYGYGESFAVCVNKDKCKVHWAAEMKEKQKRAKAVAKGGATKARSDAALASAEKRRAAEDKRRIAEQKRYSKAIPAIMKAVAAAVKKAPTKATGLLATRVVTSCQDWNFKSAKGAEYVPVGKTAEDALRHAAFLTMMSEISYRPGDAAKICHAFGLDLVAIVDEANPPEKGVCKKCGCTDTTPCDDAGQPCAWTDKTETLCTACVTPAPAKKKPARKKARK